MGAVARNGDGSILANNGAKTMQLSRTSFAMIGCALTAVSLTGCAGGHGKHTSEGLSQAQERMAEMKSATAWDMARQQYAVGDLSKALKSVDESLSYNGSVPKAHTLRGRILIELGQIEPAIESLQSAVAIDPNHVEGHYYLGIAMERISDDEGALAAYETAALLEPANAQYVIAAAEMLIDLERLEEARTLLDSRRATLEHNAGIRQSLAHVAMLKENYDEAVDLFREARLLDPEDLSILEDLAVAQMADEQWAEAEFSAKTLLDHDGYQERRDIQRMRARCLVELDRPVEARAILLALTSSKEGGNDWHAWRDLGNVALMIRDDQRARMAARRVIALRPELTEGYEIMAAAHMKAGNLEDALNNLNVAFELNPRSSRLALVRGVILDQLGRTAEAEEAFRIASKLDPNDERARQMLAVVSEDEEN